MHRTRSKNTDARLEAGYVYPMKVSASVIAGTVYQLTSKYRHDIFLCTVHVYESVCGNVCAQLYPVIQTKLSAPLLL